MAQSIKITIFKLAIPALAAIAAASIITGCGGGGGGGGGSPIQVFTNPGIQGTVYQSDGKTNVGPNYEVNLDDNTQSIKTGTNGTFSGNVTAQIKSGSSHVLWVFDSNGNFVGSQSVTISSQQTTQNITLPSVGTAAPPGAPTGITPSIK